MLTFDRPIDILIGMAMLVIIDVIVGGAIFIMAGYLLIWFIEAIEKIYKWSKKIKESGNGKDL